MNQKTTLKMKNKKKYTIEQYLKAAEIGEVSLIDAKHVCSLLEEAKQINKRDHHKNKYAKSAKPQCMSLATLNTV